jgi:DNA polymerase IV
MKIRLAPFRTFTRSRTLEEPTCAPEAVAATALDLFEAFERDAPVRLLGVGISNLVRPDGTGPAPARPQAGGAGPEQLVLA